MLRFEMMDGKRIAISAEARWSPAEDVDYGVEDVREILFFEAGFQVDDGELPREGQEPMPIRILRLTDPVTKLQFAIPLSLNASEEVANALLGKALTVPVSRLIRP